MTLPINTVALDLSASEVTTIWRYTNVYIIIIIIIIKLKLAILSAFERTYDFLLNFQFCNFSEI